MACGFNYKSMTPYRLALRLGAQEPAFSFTRDNEPSVTIMKINEYFCYIWLRCYRDLAALVLIWLLS